MGDKNRNCASDNLLSALKLSYQIDARLEK